jgi:hypothetical protein
MPNILSVGQIQDLATKNGYEYAALKAVILVESSGQGFSQKTGRIIIQFEPSWFKRMDLEWQNRVAGHIWENNGVGDQTAEWQAFDDAFGIDPDAAMKATSIGMMQVMGFHYRELGFDTVGHMWDFAKVSEANQVSLGIGFIKSIPKLHAALQNKDWATFAYYYNGAGYKRFNYDIRLKHGYQQSLN